jgi:hypothetical protein
MNQNVRSLAALERAVDFHGGSSKDSPKSTCAKVNKTSAIHGVTATSIVSFATIPKVSESIETKKEQNLT